MNYKEAIKLICYVVILVISITSCNNLEVKQENPVKKDYIIISGRVSNKQEKDEIKIRKIHTTSDFEKTIKLNEDGSFLDTIRPPVNDNYSPIDTYVVFGTISNFVFDVNMRKGDNIVVNIDPVKEIDKVIFSGDNTLINSYYYEERMLRKKINNDFLPINELEDVEFKKSRMKIKSEVEILLNNSKGIPEDFKEKQKRSLYFEYILNLNRCVGYHKGKNEDYVSSSELINELNTFNTHNLTEEDIEYSWAYNNLSEVDYKFSNAYRNLLWNYYYRLSLVLAQNENMDIHTARLTIYGKIKNQFIKNDILYKFTKREIFKVNNPDKFYTTYKVQGCTDEKYNKEIFQLYIDVTKLSKGKPSPLFENYKNYKGGTASLGDFRGKYVLIDVWATWCGPCIKEFPYLKKLEKQYHGKNIAFVSISIDEEKDYDKWKKMIEENKLSGVQLLALREHDDTQKFIDDYFITAIPRFILIDPNGNIVTSKAPKPSSADLKKLLDDLVM